MRKVVIIVFMLLKVIQLTAMSAGQQGLNDADDLIIEFADLAKIVNFLRMANAEVRSNTNSSFVTLPYLNTMSLDDSETNELLLFTGDITQEGLKGIKKLRKNIRALVVRRSLGGKAIMPEQIRLLSEAFPLVSALDLSGTRLTPEAMEVFAEQGRFMNLQKLDLSDNKIGKTGIACLTKAPFALSIKELHLRNARITWSGIKLLVETNKLLGLAYLDLSNNEIDDSNVLLLQDALFSQQLEYLNLESTYFTPKGINAILNSDKFPLLNSRAETLFMNERARVLKVPSKCILINKDARKNYK